MKNDTIIALPEKPVSIPNIRRVIKGVYNVSDASLKEIFSAAKIMKLPKKHIITESVEQDEYCYFIESGIARTYNIINDREVTVGFSQDGMFIITAFDYYKVHVDSVFKHEAIQLCSDAVICAVPVVHLHNLFDTNIEVANWARIIYETTYLKLRRRFVSQLYESAESRYNALMSANPSLFNRVNLGHIASYLGMSQVTLSLLRRKEQQ